MRSPLQRCRGLLAVPLICIAGLSRAGGDAASPFGLELSAGLKYDTNVSIPEIESASSQGDYAAVLGADLDYRAALGERTGLDLSYGLDQSLHDRFSAFDVQNHMLSGDLAHDFGATDAGATVRRIETRLDNEAYLAMTQFAPWTSRFFGRRVFVRADYTLTDKDFEDLPSRDAVQHAAGGDVFWFLDGARTYLLAGYRYRREDAELAEFDYRSHNLKLRVSRRFELMGCKARAKAGWQYEARDYRGPAPVIGARRQDDRHRLQAELEVQFGESLFGVLDYEYGDYDSDLPSADYAQQVVSVRLGFRT